MYLVLALLAALENIFPPIPADSAVALGAFLSHRGVTSPWWVFGVTIIANTASAAVVYWLARRYGPRFAGTAIGRRLLPPHTLATIERKYVRWGLPAIFLCRLLPGIRAIVPPFTGIIGLSPRRALLPIAGASAIWYGFVTVAGVAVGAEWETMAHLLGAVNRMLALIGAMAGMAALAWFILQARSRRRRSQQPVTGQVVDAVLERMRPRGGAS
ncbi:MAG TPA: DedA family protein [Gemmatimonadales bacterium]|nr:DedA family protein [Gemmatimonadales bacterium]